MALASSRLVSILVRRCIASLAVEFFHPALQLTHNCTKQALWRGLPTINPCHSQMIVFPPAAGRRRLALPSPASSRGMCHRNQQQERSKTNRKSNKRMYWVIALAMIAALALPWMALADNTVPDGDGVEPVISQRLDFSTVCAGSTTAKTVLIVINRNGNAGSTNVFANGSEATISVLSVSGSGLTAIDPSGKITLPTNWSGVANNTDSPSVSSSVTLVAGAAGSFSGSVIYRASGKSSKDSGPLTRDGTLAVSATVIDCTPNDTTPPVITVPADITAEATGASGATVTFDASATDAVDGSPAVTCSPASGSTYALGTTAVTCSATDAAGNKGTASFKVTVQDTTAPVVTVPADMTAEATGPTGAMVTFSASATDLVDGIITPSCSPASSSTFKLGETTVTCSATDGAGNKGSASFNVTVQDTTPPVVTVPADITAEATSPAGATVPFAASATDAVDGPVAVTCTPASGSTFALGTTTVTCSATDAAGNTGAKAFNITVQDTTPPTITWVGGPANESSHYYGQVPAAPKCTADDAVSGNVLCTIGGYDPAVGPHTLTATATDNAGNSATETRSYTVLAWTLQGFYQPVDMNGVVNVVKGGSTVPLKFEAFAGPTELTSTSTVKSFVQTKVACDSAAVLDEVEVTTTGGTALRYDSVAGQFVQNWQTPKTAGVCYKVTMTTSDGSTLSANFKLK